MSKNLTKRAFLASVMALLLCVSSLMGTTYAWFTDSVTSSNNVITSGSLDVELYYQNSETNDWTEVTDQTNIFKKDTLWEPGHVEVITLKVANEGTLALKYQLGINVDGNETPATNINGGKYTLSDYIEFGVVDGEHTFANREDAIAAIGDSKKINEGYTATSSLDAGKAAIVTLVVYMPTTVGNEANPAKDSAPSINLGIKLLATQYTAENDAFGPDYDAGAEFVDIAYTVAGDNAALADVLETINTAKEKNVLVQLDQDVEWETGAAHGSTPWVDENAVVENLIIDAKGATITATGDGVGPIRMANGGTLTIKNATIKDNSASYAEDSWEFGYLEFAGNLVFENVDFVNAIM
ncbi:MAG: hypothetical protein IJW46_05140, partial [Clostridia bacterium]|nr:hypothetical protein [Clostridia bacterium]